MIIYLIARLAEKFSPSEVEVLVDPTDKIKSRLYAKVRLIDTLLS